MTYYILVSSILLFTIGLVWKKDDWFNVIIKLIILGISIWGLFVYLSILGYIIKTVN